MFNKTLKELSQSLQSGECSSVELTKSYLEKIKAEDNSVNSYITVTEELALEQAAAADERIKNGQAQSLTGIPIAHKDIFCTQGVKTSCGSKMLDNFIAP